MKVHPRASASVMPAVTSVLRCIGCGATADILAERKFRCTQCGNLFEVHHDYPGFSKGAAKAMKDDFRHRSNMYGRPKTYGPRTRSGVWCFHELVLPNLDESQLITLGEGIVPIVPAGRNLMQYIGGDVDIWMMLEGQGPSGSFKDFGGAAMISTAKAAGVSSVFCSSTGDTSAMLAAYSAAAGIPCGVLLPEGQVTHVQVIQPAAHGARVIQLPTDFDGCMRVMQYLVEHHGAYPGNSLNPTRIEGHKATVFLIAQFFRWKLPEWIAVPVGNGSNSSSIGKAQRELVQWGFVPSVSRILGCQSKAANPLAASWESVRACDGDRLSLWRKAYTDVKAGETLATATRIGSPVSREKVMREVTHSNGVMESVAEEALEGGMHAAARDGFLVCPQTGIAIAGVQNAVQRGDIGKGETVVIVSTATGMKFAPVYERRTQGSIERARDDNPETIAKMLNL
ncbi:MAG TPA: pyridoxal-phosphate dependent enzyme [Candidatus Paceibacterota bacterium]